MKRRVTIVFLVVLAGVIVSVSGGPRLSKIKSDERIVFFDTAAYRVAATAEASAAGGNGGGDWVVPVHGWIYEPEDSTVRKKAIEAALKARFDLRVSAEARGIFDRRVNLFLSDNERGKRIGIRFAGDDKTHAALASEPNGHFRVEIRLSDEHLRRLGKDGVLAYEAVTRAGLRTEYHGRVHVPAAEGVVVVSDIDDTIKLTEVTERKRLIERTFLEEFQAVPGMAQTYQEWAAKRATFHFVSSSPWQLYEPLREFTEREGFPGATFHLKSVRFRDTTFFDLFKKGSETKPLAIRPILERYPEQKFILVGDSGEEDPEVYAGIYREFPGRVLRIFIRNVTKARRDDERFAKVFEGIDDAAWVLFEDPKELVWPGGR